MIDRVHTRQNTRVWRVKSCAKPGLGHNRKPIFAGRDPLDDAAEILRVAFPARSERQRCRHIARVCGCSETAARAILRKRTKSPSWTVMHRAIEHAGPALWALPGIQAHVAHLLGAE